MILFRIVELLAIVSVICEPPASATTSLPGKTTVGSDWQCGAHGMPFYLSTHHSMRLLSGGGRRLA
ncbi:MAG: hypothetical protein JXR03_21630 [Cyclobacteriaceae bacterium]